MHLPRSSGAMRPECAGFGLVDVAFGALLMVVAIGGLTAAVMSALDLGRANEETAVADTALRTLVEEMHLEPFGQLFALYNADPSDDPGGAGTAPGARFDVAGLTPQEGDDAVGELRFPTVDGPGSTLLLRENLADAALGMPRDLNGDGVVDGNDHSDDYYVLPVTVEVRWRGVSGNRTLAYRVLLVE